MVPPVFPRLVVEKGKRPPFRLNERRYLNQDIDYRLRGHARDCRAADVLDAERDVTPQMLTEPSREPGESFGPGRVIVDQMDFVARAGIAKIDETVADHREQDPFR